MNKKEGNIFIKQSVKEEYFQCVITSKFIEEINDYAITVETILTPTTSFNREV